MSRIVLTTNGLSEVSALIDGTRELVMNFETAGSGLTEKSLSERGLSRVDFKGSYDY